VKKNHEVHYGWKNHVKADLETKLIITASTTPANIHDSQVFEALLVATRKQERVRRNGTNLSPYFDGQALDFTWNSPPSPPLS
jgi:IS5 family transposase